MCFVVIVLVVCSRGLRGCYWRRCGIVDWHGRFGCDLRGRGRGCFGGILPRPFAE